MHALLRLVQTLHDGHCRSRLTDVVAKIIRIRLFSRSWLISLAMMQPYRYGVMLLENRSPYVQCRSLCIANDSVLGIGLLCLWCHRIVLDILSWPISDCFGICAYLFLSICMYFFSFCWFSICLCLCSGFLDFCMLHCCQGIVSMGGPVFWIGCLGIHRCNGCACLFFRVLACITS